MTALTLLPTRLSSSLLLTLPLYFRTLKKEICTRWKQAKLPPPLEEGYYGRKYEFNLQNQMEEQPRPQLIQDEIDQVYVLLDEENLSKAQQLLDQLAKKLPNDPELTKAQTMITFLSE